MKKAPPLLKKVDKKIQKLFKKLKIEPLEKENILGKIKSGMGRFYYGTCQDKNGKKYFLKVRVMNSREVLRQFKAEVKVYQFLNNISKKYPLEFLFPSILKAGKFEGLDWYLRDFEEGKLAGEMRDDLGYKKFFLEKCSPQRVSKALFSLQKIPKESAKDLKLYIHGGWWYEQDFNHYKRTFLKFFLKSPFNQNLLQKEEILMASKKLKENYEFLDKTALFLTHGDFYPNNLLITNKGKLLILDWELLHLNNQCFDLCFAWLLSHRDKNWQKEFFNLITHHQSPEFKKLLPLILISLSTRFTNACWQKIRKMKKVLPFDKVIKSREFATLKYYLNIFKKAVSKDEDFIYHL